MWLWGCFHTRAKSAFVTSLPRMNSLWFKGILFSDIPQNDINKPVRAITSCEVRKSREWVWGEKNEPTLDNQEVGVQVLSPWSRSLSSQHNLWDLTVFFNRNRETPYKTSQVGGRHLRALFSCFCGQKKDTIIQLTSKVSVLSTTQYCFRCVSTQL